MVTVEDVKLQVPKLPATLHIKGDAISRYVYDGRGITIDGTFLRNYNWGAVCSGATRLAEDLWKLAGCPVEMAAFLAPTLSEYILSRLPDNFDIELQLRKFMAAVLKEDTLQLYATYVKVIASSTPVFVEVSKASMRLEEDTTTKVVADAVDEQTRFVETEFGRQRKGIPDRLSKELNKLRGLDDDKQD